MFKVVKKTESRCREATFVECAGANQRPEVSWNPRNGCLADRRETFRRARDKRHAAAKRRFAEECLASKLDRTPIPRVRWRGLHHCFGDENALRPQHLADRIGRPSTSRRRLCAPAPVRQDRYFDHGMEDESFSEAVASRHADVITYWIARQWARAHFCAAEPSPRFDPKPRFRRFARHETIGSRLRTLDLHDHFGPPLWQSHAVQGRLRQAQRRGPMASQPRWLRDA